MRRIFMIREFKILLLMIVLIACFGAGVVVGNVDKKPQSSLEVGFYRGTDYLNLAVGLQDAYVSGVHDAMTAITHEALHKILEIALEVGQLGLDWEHAYAEFMTRLERQYADTITRLYNTLNSLPDNVRNTQLRAVATLYMRDHPAEQHNNAALLVWRALADAEWR